MENKNLRYLGTFWLDDAVIPGEIIHNKETGTIRLRLTKVFENDRDLIMETNPVPTGEITTTEEEVAWMINKSEDFAAWREEHAKKVRLYNWIGFIKGTLNNGTSVSLFNCHRISDKANRNSQTRQLTFSAEYILWDDPDCVGLNEIGERVDREYHKFVCVVENALGWLDGASRIQTEKYGQLELKSSIKGKHRFSWNDAQIRFSTHVASDIWGSRSEEKFTLEEHLKFEITTKSSLPAHEFLKIRSKIIAMLSFALKANINIVSQYLCHNDDKYVYMQDGVPMEGMPIEEIEYHITTNEPKRRIWKTNLNEYNFTLSAFKGKEMSKLLTDLEPIFSLYTSLFKYTDMPLEMVYLNMLQAVEKFHSIYHSYGGSKSNYVKQIQKRFGKNPNFSELLKPLFFSDSQMNEHTDHVILLSSIADLLVDKGNENDIFYIFYGVDREFPHKLTDTRHYYTHYGNGKRDKVFVGHEMYDAIKVMKLLLEYRVSQHLGVDISERIREEVEDFLVFREHNKYMISP